MKCVTDDGLAYQLFQEYSNHPGQSLSAVVISILLEPIRQY